MQDNTTTTNEKELFKGKIPEIKLTHCHEKSFENSFGYDPYTIVTDIILGCERKSSFVDRESIKIAGPESASRGLLAIYHMVINHTGDNFLLYALDNEAHPMLEIPIIVNEELTTFYNFANEWWKHYFIVPFGEDLTWVDEAIPIIENIFKATPCPSVARDFDVLANKVNKLIDSKDSVMFDLALLSILEKKDVRGGIQN